VTCAPLEGFVLTNVYEAGTWWQWSVFGPAGGAMGIAATEADARHKVRQATQAVKNPTVDVHALARP
jgi:hypothetical protein